jgi:hypothetical protein
MMEFNVLVVELSFVKKEKANKTEFLLNDIVPVWDFF